MTDPPCMFVRIGFGLSRKNDPETVNCAERRVVVEENEPLLERVLALREILKA